MDALGRHNQELNDRQLIASWTDQLELTQFKSVKCLGIGGCYELLASELGCERHHELSIV
jgi:hypothetical protein